MAKTLTIKDPVSGENYTLEYTRKSVEIMEKQGFPMALPLGELAKPDALPERVTPHLMHLGCQTRR